MEQLISKDNLQACYGGDDTWDYKYVEPVPGENERLEQEEKRAKIQEERYELVREFEKKTVEWAALETESADTEVKRSGRTDLVHQLQENYWRLDPYIRARTIYHRDGVVTEKGEVNFKGAGHEK